MPVLRAARRGVLLGRRRGSRPAAGLSRAGPGRRGRRLTLFLAQYWGGPQTYDAERGQPRLRMRHAPFAIGSTERDAWLARMRAAIAAADPPPEAGDRLRAYFDLAPDAMRNRH